MMLKARANRVPVTVIYASETGKAERYAKSLFEIFKCGFNARVFSAEQYRFSELEEEELLIVVASTFGNGEPPENGKSFGAYIRERTDHLDGLRYCS